MSDYDVKIDFEPDQVIGHIKTGSKKAVRIITSEFVKDANFYCRQDTGELKRSAILSSDYENGDAVWNTDYARKVYYTGTPSMDNNPNARLEWARVAAEANQDKYLEIAKKIIDEELGT